MLIYVFFILLLGLLKPNTIYPQFPRRISFVGGDFLRSWEK